MLTRFIEGTTLKFEESHDAHLFGEAAADVHLQSSGFESSHQRYRLDKQHLIKEPLAHILPFISHRPDDQEFLETFVQLLSAKFSEAESKLFDYGFCHGDFHGFNAHYENEDIYHFDFDCCGFGYRIFDLATFKWSARLRQKEKEWWPSFLEGYRSKRNINEHELDLIEEFVAIRDLWLFGLHIGGAHDFAKGWLDHEYINRRIKFLKDSADKIKNKTKQAGG